MVLASFCPNLADPDDTPPAPLSLKILVDCSGSMGGDSMAGAKDALRRILGQLGARDKISYSRFGSDIQHDLSRLTACGPETLAALDDSRQRALKAQLDQRFPGLKAGSWA